MDSKGEPVNTFLLAIGYLGVSVFLLAALFMVAYNLFVAFKYLHGIIRGLVVWARFRRLPTLRFFNMPEAHGHFPPIFRRKQDK